MTHRYKKLPVKNENMHAVNVIPWTSLGVMQFNVMPRTSTSAKFINSLRIMTAQSFENSIILGYNNSPSSHEGPAIATVLQTAAVNGVTVASVVALSITLSSVQFVVASTISSKLS